MPIILEEQRFIWKESELSEFREMWENGDSVVKMARRFDCKEIDIALVAMDQAEKKKIDPRPSGLLGHMR